jgi:hypothetical protein
MHAVLVLERLERLEVVSFLFVTGLGRDLAPRFAPRLSQLQGGLFVGHVSSGIVVRRLGAPRTLAGGRRTCEAP